MKKLFLISFVFLCTTFISLAQVKVLQNGNVGIGTISPSVPLQVQKTATGPAFMIGGAFYGQPRIQVYGLDSNANAWMGLGADMGGGPYEHSIYFPTYGSGKLTFGDYNGTTYNTRMMITANGNVGIGTTSPNYKLTISGTDNIFAIDNTAIFVAKNSGGSFEQYLWPRWNDDIMYLNYGSSGFKIRNYNSTITTIFMNNSGYVGIGTTSPNNLLQVAGLINFNDTYYNTFLGSSSGSSNSTGTKNTFLGYQSGNSNSTGANNTFSGYQSGKVNTSSYNTFMGSYSGVANTTGNYNTFFGNQTGIANTTGYSNCFIGHLSGATNIIGNYNTFTGWKAGYFNTGGFNTYNGGYAGYSNSTGTHNTALGYRAGYTYATGNDNTFIGNYADAGANNLSNATAIGNAAIVDANNKAVIGNASVTWVGTMGASTWQTSSDGRFKINIQENVKGLEFINKLRPVTYNMNTQVLDDFVIQNMPDSIKTIHRAGMDFAPSTAIVHSGFIAQEVEQAANSCDFTSSIVHTPADTNTGLYSLGYSEMVVPLVKAVQELNTIITQQGLEIQTLKTRLDECCKNTTPAIIDGK